MSSTAKEHRTVSRIMSVLEEVAAAGDAVSLARLCDRLRVPKSSLHGLVQGLLAMGYLSESAAGYQIGPAVVLLSGGDSPPLHRAARQSLETLAARTGESAALCVATGDAVMYVDIVESRNSIRYVAPMGTRRPMWPTSAGKCFLADLEPARRDAILRRHLGDEGALSEAHRQLEQIRSDGISFNRGETVPDVFAVASPIQVRGRTVACLQVAGPGERLRDTLDQVAETVRAEARRISVRSDDA
jgi:DNA-binding IclR family transcriptional regulator